MTQKFLINAAGFSPFEREDIKRSIIDQGRTQHVTARVITEESGTFRISLDGDDLFVIAYEAAVRSWFGQHDTSLLP